MKQIVLSTAVIFSVLAAPSFAQTNVNPYPGLEGLGCVALIEKLDVTLNEIEISEELKTQIVDLREQGATEKQAGDEVACATSLTSAFQLLVPLKQ